MQSLYKAKSNDEKLSILLNLSEELPEFSVPEIPILYRTKMDYVSLAIINSTSKKAGSAIPLTSKGDGNCLFSSLSLLLLGDNSLITELKLRAMIYLAQNYSHLESKASDYLFSRHSASPKKSLEKLYSPIGWSTPWVILALSMSCKINLKIIYPAVNGPKDIAPRELSSVFLNGTRGSPLYQIMWTSTSVPENITNGSTKYWTPNHFVPLISKTEAGKMNFGQGTCYTDEYFLGSLARNEGLIRFIEEQEQKIARIKAAKPIRYSEIESESEKDDDVQMVPVVDELQQYSRVPAVDGPFKSTCPPAVDSSSKSSRIPAVDYLSKSSRVPAVLGSSKSSRVSAVDEELKSSRAFSENESIISYLLIDKLFSGMIDGEMSSDCSSEVINIRSPLLQKLPGNKFISMAEAYRMASDNPNVLDEVPHGDKSNSFCFVNGDNLKKDNRGTLYYDDSGLYGHHSSKTYHLLMPEMKHITLKEGVYYLPRRTPEIMTPQPHSDSIVKVYEYKSNHKTQKNFTRKIYRFENIRAVLYQFQGKDYF